MNNWEEFMCMECKNVFMYQSWEGLEYESLPSYCPFCGTEFDFLTMEGEVL